MIPLPYGEALRNDYLPAWMRMAVWFIALVGTHILISVLRFIF